MSYSYKLSGQWSTASHVKRLSRDERTKLDYARKLQQRLVATSVNKCDDGTLAIRDQCAHKWNDLQATAALS